MVLIKKITGVAVTSVLIASCGIRVESPREEAIKQNDLTTAVRSLAVNVNQYPHNKIICDPLSQPGSTSTSFEKGIIAQLFYKTAGMPSLLYSKDYVQFAQRSEKTFFFADMNVPTRVFTEGFSTQNDDFIKDDQNQKLIEYFGLQMNTNLVLSATDDTGEYELALLSDDGTTLSIKSGTSEIPDEKLIDNEGDHPTRMGCSSRVIQMRRNVMVPIEVTYYQGPRFHISNVLIWRKATEAGKDPLCKSTGNELFFNPNRNSEPQKAFRDLQARGWKVLSNDNFLVTRTLNQYNPCVQGTDPVISNFAIGEVVLTNVSVSWLTDIEATAQIQLTYTTTGVVTVTSADNLLRKDHQIQLSQLQPNTTYEAQAISVSSDLGRSVSGILTFTTQ